MGQKTFNGIRFIISDYGISTKAHLNLADPVVFDAIEKARKFWLQKFIVRGCLYLFEGDGLYKIGLSVNVEERFRNCAYAESILWQLPVGVLVSRYEAALHAYYNVYWAPKPGVGVEWFKLPQSEVKQITSCETVRDLCVLLQIEEYYDQSPDFDPLPLIREKTGVRFSQSHIQLRGQISWM